MLTGSVYYFDPVYRYAVTGIQEIDGGKYYYTEDGRRLSNVDEIEEELNKDHDGFVSIEGETYYFENGSMQTGWKDIDGKRFYFSANGTMQTGLTLIDDAWYYLSDTGEMQTGLVL